MEGAGCRGGAGEAIRLGRLSGVLFSLPATWAGVSSLRRGLPCIIGRGCVSQMSKVNALGLMNREILGLGVLSLVWGPRVLAGRLQGDSLEHDGILGDLGSNWREAYAVLSPSAASLSSVPGCSVPELGSQN